MADDSRKEFDVWFDMVSGKFSNLFREAMFKPWKEAIDRVDWARHTEGMLRLLGGADIVQQMDPALREKFYHFRNEHLQQEVQELVLADTPEEAVDALVDIIVMALGTLLLFGVDVRRAWFEVLLANLVKKPGTNRSRPNAFGLPDLVKPDGWKSPDHSGNVGLLQSVFETMAREGFIKEGKVK